MIYPPKEDTLNATPASTASPVEPIIVNGRRVVATVAIVTAFAAGYGARASGAELDPGGKSTRQQVEEEERAGGIWGSGMGALVRVPGGGLLGQW